jgi:hypothetical protein
MTNHSCLRVGHHTISIGYTVLAISTLSRCGWTSGPAALVDSILSLWKWVRERKLVGLQAIAPAMHRLVR